MNPGKEYPGTLAMPNGALKMPSADHAHGTSSVVLVLFGCIKIRRRIELICRFHGHGA
jgi:hypothetical protein